MTDSLLRLIGPDNLKLASRLLERAFHDDPLMGYILPDPKERAKRVAWYYDANVKHAALFGEVWATPELDGVALWLAPNHEQWSFDKLKQSGLWQMPQKLGARAAKRFMRSVSLPVPEMDELRWYLLLIGVEPEKRRTGIGRRLLAPMLARADAERMPIHLETNDESNVPFYAKHGFELIYAGRAPNGPGLWALRRPPP